MGLVIKSRGSSNNAVYAREPRAERAPDFDRNDAPEIMSLEEVAAFVGVCEKTIIKLVNEEDFPCRRVGERRLLFGRRAVVCWFNYEGPTAGAGCAARTRAPNPREYE